MKKRIVLRTLVAACVLPLVVVGATVAAADTIDGDGPPTGVVVVDGEQVPLLGNFAYPYVGFSEGEIRGAVHGLRRVEGATILYYSVGAVGGLGQSTANPFPLDVTLPGDYGTLSAADLGLVDPAGLMLYRPLFDSDGGLTSASADFHRSAPTDLIVGWAAFPEVPADLNSIDVMMPHGTIVPNIPLEDGPLEPVVGEPAPVLGQGWPQVATSAEIAGTDAAASTFELRRNTSDLSETVDVAESIEDVEVTLDANVLFDSSSAELRPEAVEKLQEVAARIAERGIGEVFVTGHTDSVGSDADNQQLSEQRARSVLDVLEPASGTAVTFRAEGKGETMPVESNATDEGKQANRRVTVKYQVEDQG